MRKRPLGCASNSHGWTIMDDATRSRPQSDLVVAANHAFFTSASAISERKTCKEFHLTPTIRVGISHGPNKNELD
jgi:hypothetical protein